MVIQKIPQEKRKLILLNLEQYEHQLNGFQDSLKQVMIHLKDYEAFEHSLKQSLQKQVIIMDHKQNQKPITPDIDKNQSLKKQLKQKADRIKAFEKNEQQLKKQIKQLKHTIASLQASLNQKKSELFHHHFEEKKQTQIIQEQKKKIQTIQQQAVQMRKELELKNLVIKSHCHFIQFWIGDFMKNTPFFAMNEKSKKWLAAIEEMIQTLTQHINMLKLSLADLQKGIQAQEHQLYKRKWINMLWPIWNQDKADEQNEKLLQLNNTVEKIQADLLEYKNMLFEMENAFSNYQKKEEILREKMEQFVQYFQDLENNKEHEFQEKLEKLNTSFNEKEQEYRKKELEYQNEIEQINDELQELKKREEQYKKIIQQLNSSLREATLKLNQSYQEENQIKTPSHERNHTTVINPFKYSRKK
jgi:chromosome segregation ATPase